MASSLPIEGSPPLPMEGSLPPDLVGTLFRVGPGGSGDGLPAGALHAIELGDGGAVSYVSRASSANEMVFWHAGSVLVLPESGLPLRYDRFLQPAEFGGDLRVPIASHVHRVAADGCRILFSVDDGIGNDVGEADAVEGLGGGTGGDSSYRDVFLRIGEWDEEGDLRTAMAIPLERATWQHDIGVTEGRVVFIESPTRRLSGPREVEEPWPPAVPFGWVPDAETWIGVVERGGDGSDVAWVRVPPCLVTHVLGAWDDKADGRGGDGAATGGAGGVIFVCCYEAPEVGQPVDLTASVVGPQGIGMSPIGGGVAVLQRWRMDGGGLERTTLDDRGVEYPRMDTWLDGSMFRYGYCVETSLTPPGGTGAQANDPAAVLDHPGLLRFDLVRDEVTSWSPGDWRAPSEPIFVRAVDGRADDEGWLLTVVDDVNRGASDLYALDASDFGRRRPEAVIHLPERLPFRSHGEWVPADRYR